MTHAEARGQTTPTTADEHDWTGSRFFENSIVCIRSQVVKHNLMYFSNFVIITLLLIANSRENRTHRSMEMRADNDSATCSFEGTLAVLASRDKQRR